MPYNLTPEQRSYCMSRIKGKDTGLETRVRSELHKRGLRFRKHVKELPGKPDVVFWHGYRFPTWEHKVSDFWKTKISKTRERDTKNDHRLYEMGWTVIRLWQHDFERDHEVSIQNIMLTVRLRAAA